MRAQPRQPDLFNCECGNSAIGFTSNREPICERCRAMEKTMNLQIKANRKVGVSPKVPKRGMAMDWETRYALYESEPIAGASLSALDWMLSHAETILKAA